MKSFTKICIVIFSLSTTLGFSQKENLLQERAKVKMETNHGTIILELYNETPIHRDNFIKLVKRGTYDKLLFHRVIENFMIQSGDTKSNTAQPNDTLGANELPYTIKAEFHSKLFHKKGVLAAARGDHPERESSSTQFYIVQGKVYNDSLLNISEKRINNWLARHYMRKDKAYKSVFKNLKKAIKKEDRNTYKTYADSIDVLSKKYTNYERYTIPKHHRETYKTLGGAAHLDQNYTVFGEVISGLEVVDAIAKSKTNKLDRPIKDVQIISVKIID